MEIVYFSRNPNAGFSIKKVFGPIINHIASNSDCSVSNYEMPNVGASLLSIIKNIVFVFKHRSKKGINHITGDITYCAIALIFCKSVITIHDTYDLDHSASTFKEKIKNYIYGLFWFIIPILLSNKTTCISSKSTDRLKSHLPKFLHKKIVVIHNPVDNSLVYTPILNSTNEPRILHIGTKENKNLNRLVISLKGVKCRLDVIGRLNDKQQFLLDESGIKYNNRWNLTDAEIVEAYRNCDIVAFVSLYEGFGMPIIEAQSSGRAVVTSNIEPMLSIAGSNAVIADPYDIKSIKSCFVKLINDPQYYQSTIQSGLDNVVQYKVESIAAKYLELYNEL